MYILYVIAGALFGWSLFLILCDIGKVPTRKASRAMRGVQKQLKVGDGRINSSLEDVAVWIAKHIRLSEIKKANLQADLTTARMDISPEMWVANAIVKSAVIAVVALPSAYVWRPGAVMSLILALLNYYELKKQLRRKVAQHRDALEYELPRLVFTIEKTLRHNRNVIQMLESYQQIASPDMRQELEITLADMRSGSQETAITRLETRVGSSMMSDVCRGLLSILRGDDTASYWTTLTVKFSDHQRNLLKAQADKIPSKVNRLSLALVFCYVIMWFGVLIIQAVQALMEMF